MNTTANPNIFTEKNPAASYPNVFPNYVRAEYRNAGEKWPVAVVALYMGTEAEAAACVEGLMNGKPHTEWGVSINQISHWGGGPAK